MDPTNSKQAALHQIEPLLLAGIDSGEPTPMAKADWDELKNRVRQHGAHEQDSA